MADVLTREQRRLNMSRIKGRNTKPELLIRKALHALGLRYRLHDRRLPGHPDMVFPRYQCAVFVHGCFWHQHHCHLVKKPGTRVAFWEEKLAANKARDQRAISALQSDGWRLVIVWECALRGTTKRPFETIIQLLERHIRNGNNTVLELSGNETISRA
jgi:DNA mismatch endonuclease, patch repair protein